MSKEQLKKEKTLKDDNGYNSDGKEFKDEFVQEVKKALVQSYTNPGITIQELCKKNNWNYMLQNKFGEVD